IRYRGMGRKDLIVGTTQDLLRRVPEGLLSRLVGKDVATILILDPRQSRQPLHEPGKPFLALPQIGLHSNPLGNLLSSFGVESRVVESDRRLRRDTQPQTLRPFGEYSRFRMSEEESADHLSGPAHHRDREVTPDREMTLRHSSMR